MKRNPQVTGVEMPEKTQKIVEKNVEKMPKMREKKFSAHEKAFLACGIVGLTAGVALAATTFLLPESVVSEINFPKVPSTSTVATEYSKLTGVALAAGENINAPAYCIQIPNGTDGARPQAGLNDAGVVFEAIAEAGITRFAAIFQNPSTAVIGPIRSLRTYYLQWDTPFDCTIVHAGGSGDALAAVAKGGYKDLTENYAYMYRGRYSNRLWNNLFTTSAELAQFSADRGYTSSRVNGFSRMTPAESTVDWAKNVAVRPLTITETADGDTSAVASKAAHIEVKFGGWASFNVTYDYDAASNAYLRSYENGTKHEVYKCPSQNLGEKDPEDVCQLTQMAPNVVAVIKVAEKRAADNYHEDVTVIGSGEAYIFQNGGALHGTWVKGSDGEQIKFFNAAGAEILLAPGQTFVSAVPTYGSVAY